MSGDGVKECCKDLSNRSAVTTPNPETPDLSQTTCTVCGCRHFELTVDPGTFEVELTE